MDKFTYDLIWTFGMFLSLLWTVYTLFSTWSTSCFSLLKAYSTILLLGFNMIWSNFIKYEGGD